MKDRLKKAAKLVALLGVTALVVWIQTGLLPDEPVNPTSVAADPVPPTPSPSVTPASTQPAPTPGAGTTPVGGGASNGAPAGAVSNPGQGGGPPVQPPLPTAPPPPGIVDEVCRQIPLIGVVCEAL